MNSRNETPKFRVWAAKWASLKEMQKPRGWIYGARWAGQPCEARVCKVMVGIADGWWCEDLTGAIRKAIQVTFDGRVVYLDNEDGRALQVFLKGWAPMPRMRWLPAASEPVDDPESAISYKAQAE